MSKIPFSLFLTLRQLYKNSQLYNTVEMTNKKLQDEAAKCVERIVLAAQHLYQIERRFAQNQQRRQKSPKKPMQIAENLAINGREDE